MCVGLGLGSGQKTNNKSKYYVFVTEGVFQNIAASYYMDIEHETIVLIVQTLLQWITITITFKWLTFITIHKAFINLSFSISHYNVL